MASQKKGQNNRVSLTQREKAVFGKDLTGYFEMMEEDLAEHEALLVAVQDVVPADEIIDYMLEEKKLQVFEIIGDLGEAIIAQITRMVMARIREQKAEISDLASPLTRKATLGLTGRAREKQKQRLLRARGRMKPQEELLMETSVEFGEVYMGFAERIKLANRGIFKAILDDAFCGAQMFESLGIRTGLPQTRQVNPDDANGFAIEIGIVQEHEHMEDDPKFGKEGREVVTNFLMAILLARSLELKQVCADEDKGLIRATADEVYRKFTHRLRQEKTIKGQGYEVEHPVVSQITFSPGRDFIECVCGEVHFNLPHGPQMTMPFSVSRLTPDLVSVYSWANPLRPVFEQYGVEAAYDEIRGLIFTALEDLLQPESDEAEVAVQEEQDEDTDEDWGEGWWLKYTEAESDETEHDEEPDSEDTIDDEPRERYRKGVRGKMTGLDRDKARTALESLGFGIRKTGTDYVIFRPGGKLGTDLKSFAMFPGSHGSGKDTANVPKMIVGILRNFGIPRRVFLEAYSHA